MVICSALRVWEGYVLKYHASHSITSYLVELGLRMAAFRFRYGILIATTKVSLFFCHTCLRPLRHVVTPVSRV